MAAGGRTAAAHNAWIVFEDESGFAMTPPIARTWAQARYPGSRLFSLAHFDRSPDLLQGGWTLPADLLAALRRRPNHRDLFITAHQ